MALGDNIPDEIIKEFEAKMLAWYKGAGGDGKPTQDPGCAAAGCAMLEMYCELRKRVDSLEYRLNNGLPQLGLI